MSQEDLQKFLEAVREDSNLQEQLKAEGSDPVAIAARAGFTVTAAEWQKTTEALSEEELETVTGGAHHRHTSRTECRHRHRHTGNYIDASCYPGPEDS